MGSGGGREGGNEGGLMGSGGGRTGGESANASLTRFWMLFDFDEWWSSWFE